MVRAGIRRRGFVGALASTLFALGGVLARPQEAHASGTVSLRAQLRTNTASVGDAVDLIVEVRREGGGGDLPVPTLPDLGAKGFTVEGPSTSSRTQTSWINGRSSSSVSTTYVYYLIASRPGRYKLPVTVKDGNRTIRAPSVPALEITGTAVTAAATTPAANALPAKARGDVFLWATIDKPTLYVGEQLTYTLEVYERLRFQNIHLRELPGFKDFWSEELPEGRPRNASVAGVGYRVHPGLRRALFPQRSGTLTVTPAQVGVGLRRRISGQAIEVTVLPLPAEGQPPGFSGNNVGEYTIDATVDRAKTKLGEPFTLTVTIKGNGNIRVLDPGEWPELVDMRRYDPKLEVTQRKGAIIGGDRRYEFLVIPERPGNLEIPPHSVIFFDPETATYETATSKTISITVTGDPADAPPPESPAPVAALADDDDLLLAPIYDLEVLPRTELEKPWLTPKRWVLGMIGAPLVAALAVLGGGLRRRFAGDAQAQARIARIARQRTRITEARAACASGDGFYPTIAQLLQALAVDRAGPQGQGLPRRALLKVLADDGVTEADLSRLRELLDRCDGARFGAAPDDSESARGEVFEQTLKLVQTSSLSRRGQA